ncbi:MAG TPA: hypothetical protein VN698_03310 [Bacteroidia bacterium]|nr:hypothetical protein [Bacteroidia bacterium]
MEKSNSIFTDSLLNSTCCQSGKKSMIKAIAEDDTEMLQIPAKLTKIGISFPSGKPISAIITATVLPN